MGLPGVKVGPLDPDATAEFGQVAQKNSARTLIRYHLQQHPVHLRRELSRKLDPERTKGLDLDEVKSYLGGLKMDNGDPCVPDGAQVVGASVRGESDQDQVLTFTYRKFSKNGTAGRSGKWYAPYNEDVLPSSYASGSDLRRVREMKDRGVVEFDREGLHTQVTERQLREARRENAALRKLVEGQGGDAGDVPAAETDARPDNVIADENQELGTENAELKERVRLLEQHFNATGQPLPEKAPDADAPATAAEEPPFEGYDDKRADELAKFLKAEDTSDEQRNAVLDYERSHANRKGVVAAAEESLGKGS